MNRGFFRNHLKDNYITATEVRERERQRDLSLTDALRYGRDSLRRRDGRIEELGLFSHQEEVVRDFSREIDNVILNGLRREVNPPVTIGHDHSSGESRTWITQLNMRVNEVIATPDYQQMLREQFQNMALYGRSPMESVLPRRSQRIAVPRFDPTLNVGREYDPTEQLRGLSFDHVIIDEYEGIHDEIMRPNFFLEEDQ